MTHLSQFPKQFSKALWAKLIVENIGADGSTIYGYTDFKKCSLVSMI